MRLTVIRHGLTSWNVQSRYQGWSDVPLTSAGTSEAELLKERLSSQGVSEVISSDLSRSVDTARIVFPNHRIRTTPELRELSFGDWEGLTYQECLDRDRDAYSQWLDDPFALAPPNGESLLAFRARVCGVVDSLIAEYGNQRTQDQRTSYQQERVHLGIVTHGGPIRIILQYLLEHAADVQSFHTAGTPHIRPCGYVQLDIDSETRNAILVPQQEYQQQREQYCEQHCAQQCEGLRQ